MTDQGYNARGVPGGRRRVPEIGFRDDAEADGDWDSEGFLRSGQRDPADLEPATGGVPGAAASDGSGPPRGRRRAGSWSELARPGRPDGAGDAGGQRAGAAYPRRSGVPGVAPPGPLTKECGRILKSWLQGRCYPGPRRRRRGEPGRAGPGLPGTGGVPRPDRPATARPPSALTREARPDLIVLDLMLPGHRRPGGLPAASASSRTPTS